MAIFSASQRTTTGTAAAAGWEVFPSTATPKPRVMEVGISQAAATASQYGLGRPAAKGVTPTTPVTFLDEQDGNNNTGLTQCAIAWGTPPTVPANFFRRLSTPATIGAGVIWTFPRGLAIVANVSIVIWNVGTNSVIDAWAVVDE